MITLLLAVDLALALPLAALVLVQRRILMERFAWLWILPSFVLLAKSDFSPAILGLTGLGLYVSIRTSRLTLITKNLLQESALAREEWEHMKGEFRS